MSAYTLSVRYITFPSKFEGILIILSASLAKYRLTLVSQFLQSCTCTCTLSDYSLRILCFCSQRSYTQYFKDTRQPFYTEPDTSHATRPPKILPNNLSMQNVTDRKIGDYISITVNHFKTRLLGRSDAFLAK